MWFKKASVVVAIKTGTEKAPNESGFSAPEKITNIKF